MFKYIMSGLAAVIVLAGFGNVQNLFISGSLPLGAAHANSSTDATSINAVNFKRGRLVQTDKAKGVWTEYDSQGTERYSFTTLSYSTNSLVLKGVKGDVRLVVNFIDNIISGEWPGHPMAPLYEVTTIERTVEAPRNDTPVPKKSPETTPIKPEPPKTIPPAKDSVPKKNTAVETVPTTVPPGKNPDATNGRPLIAAQVPNPSILTLARYEFGSFEKLEGMDWIEKEQSGRVFNYRKIGHDQRSVFLYDPTRSIMIEIDLKENMIRSGVSGDGLRPLYNITEAGNEVPSAAPLPTTPNSTGTKLSYLERTSCRLKGGKVERAGVLGNERCTTPYKDGGNICIDSSNCEGLCILPLSADNKEGAVSGTCQLNDNPFGCYSEVIAGEATPALCVD